VSYPHAEEHATGCQYEHDPNGDGEWISEIAFSLPQADLPVSAKAGHLRQTSARRETALENNLARSPERFLAL
jgi:hypothetical protein